MPSRRPCAAFEPISPDFDIRAMVESTPNFEWVVRIQADMIDYQGVEAFEKLVLIHVILGGKPLVVEGYERLLDENIFSVQWLLDNVGSKVEYPRDLGKKMTVPMTFAHYLNNMAMLTRQWSNMNYKDPDRQRIYLKDIDCPPLWQAKLQEILPSFLFYLNNSTADSGGAVPLGESDPNAAATSQGGGGRVAIAKAGDLMSCLPKEMRAENLMCYIGHEGTYTPAHREMCASLGQNLMVEASTGGEEDGELTRPGSSIWFMTESKERAVVSEYWLSRLGHDIEVESHFAQINAWKNAPFKTYVVEQRPGDFILIPPLAPHQVWNRGTRTMKVAWNRTTVETLEMAFNEALPRARMVCRDEQYKNKAIVYYTLQHYSRLLKMAATIRAKQQLVGIPSTDMKVRQLEKDFRRLHALFGRILVSETFLPEQDEKPEMIPFESYITCSYCRCNIFNRFLTCPSCVKTLDDGEEDTYDICLDCYAMGRSCACISKLKWVEQFNWTELVQLHEQWRLQILETESQRTERSPLTLKDELQRLGRTRTLAQVCQLELKKRPWRDITKAPPKAPVVEREEEIELDINGNVKRKKKKIRRSEKFVREHALCHVDKYWEPKWKQAQCSKCDKSYCYGSLFRAYDMMPQDILTDPDWVCPSCRNICSCRKCSKRPGYQQYTPQGTVLGHNTKAVADPRSVESLVDFSYSNLSWIQKAGDDTEHNTRRLKKRRQEAEAAKAMDPELDENYADEAGAHNDTLNPAAASQEPTGIPIDPALMPQFLSQATSVDEREEEFEENPEGRRQSPLTSEYDVPVPAGGILRDRNNAYDFTEAITYDYPDPDLAANLPASIEEEEDAEEEDNRQSQSYQSRSVPTASNSFIQPAQILMSSRKRKRKSVEPSSRSRSSSSGISSKKAKSASNNNTTTTTVTSKATTSSTTSKQPPPKLSAPILSNSPITSNHRKSLIVKLRTPSHTSTTTAQALPKVKVSTPIQAAGRKGIAIRRPPQASTAASSSAAAAPVKTLAPGTAKTMTPPLAAAATKTTTTTTTTTTAKASARAKTPAPRPINLQKAAAPAPASAPASASQPRGRFVRPAKRSSSAHKALAAEWSDSDSDSNSNGNRNGQTSAFKPKKLLTTTTTTTTTTTSKPVKKKTPRPPPPSGAAAAAAAAAAA